MIRKLLTLVVAVAVIVSLVVVGCVKPAPAPPAPVPAPAPTPGPAPTGPEEILVGCLASLTGMFAGFGEGGTFGVKAAVEDINKQGGVYVEEYGRKLPIKLIPVDIESDPVKTGNLAESLVVSDKVNFLVSPNSAPTVRAPAAVTAEKYKIPYVGGFGVFEPWQALRTSVTPPWEYSWAYVISIATPAPEGDFRHGKPGYTVKDTWFQELDRFAGQTNGVAGVFASDDPDGIGWYNLFPGMLEEYGLNVIGEKEKLGLFPIGTTDFTPMIKKWMDNDVQILWGNCPAPDFGTMWRQCHIMGFEPKIVSVGRAALFHIEVSAWGGDLPQGVGTEIWFRPSYEGCPGIGDTTAQSLTDRWIEETGQPLNPNIGWGYPVIQILVDAIERAGTLDKEAVNKALEETDLMTITHRVKFIGETHLSIQPLAFGQWRRTDKPEKWECPIVSSNHDFLPATAEPMFPILYE